MAGGLRTSCHTLTMFVIRFLPEGCHIGRRCAAPWIRNTSQTHIDTPPSRSANSPCRGYLNALASSHACCRKDANTREPKGVRHENYLPLCHFPQLFFASRSLPLLSHLFLGRRNFIQGKMTMIDSLIARAFLLTVGGSEFATPVLVVLCLALLPLMLTAVLVGAVVVISIAVDTGEIRGYQRYGQVDGVERTFGSFRRFIKPLRPALLRHQTSVNITALQWEPLFPTQVFRQLFYYKP